MHRNHLLNLLASYKTDELQSKDKMINFIKENKDCFERTNQLGHITASAWLVDKAEENALLMHHKKLNGWYQLGGHCDGDSDVLNVAIKEAQEESGINDIIAISPAIFDIDIHLIPTNSKDKEHFHYDVRFLLKVVSDEHFQKNNESNALMWIAKNGNNLPTTDHSVVRMFTKWQTQN